MTTAPPILDRLSALGDETRTRILALVERSELAVTELASALGASQPSVSRHLKTLAAEGWVEARVEGRNRYYRIATDLDEPARTVWKIVREEVADVAVYVADAERAHEVLEARRLRSDRFFASAAQRWDAIREELFGSATGLASLLGLVQRDWVVADLGAGTGALVETLAPFAGRVIGVDRSEEMLSAARRRLKGVDNVVLRRGELEALPLPDGEVDLAVLALVLHHVADPSRVLAETARALRPGGHLLMVDMRRHDRELPLAAEMGHVWPGFEGERVLAWLGDAGFEHARTVPLPPDPTAAGPLLFLASATRPQDNSTKRKSHE